MTEPARICILGGGFGGLYAAKRLNELPWNPPERPEILLVDSNDRFVFSPLLYELLTGELQSWEIAPPFSELLANTRIRFRQATVENIDLDNQQVYFHDGGEFSYDRLVLALGGETPMQMVPGCAEHAIPFRTVSDAYRLEERLRRLETSNRDKIRVAIAGAGYCGVELACKLSDRLQERGRVRLIEMGTEILRNSPEFNRKAAQAALNHCGTDRPG
jgi:NADH dehydrogenase